MYIFIVLASISVFLFGCASTTPDNILQPTAHKLLSKTQADIVQCAGPPLKQISSGQGIVLRYYKEAPMFEESRPFLKGSQPGIHHGCWANVLIENERVSGVEFRSAPEGKNDTDECAEIFQACSP